MGTKIKSKFSNLSPLPNSSTPNRTLHKYQKVGNLCNIFLAKIVKSTIVLVSIATDIWLRVAVKCNTMMICLSLFTVVCWIAALVWQLFWLSRKIVQPLISNAGYVRQRFFFFFFNDRKPHPALNFWSQKWSEITSLSSLECPLWSCKVQDCHYIKSTRCKR